MTFEGDALAAVGEMTDPVAVRLSKRVLEGQIHMLEAQIAQLSEVIDGLTQHEKALVSEGATDSARTSATKEDDR
jgi:hypothetical protein